MTDAAPEPSTSTRSPPASGKDTSASPRRRPPSTATTATTTSSTTRSRGSGRGADPVRGRQREAQAMPEDGLSVEDRITRDMLRIIAGIVTEADDLAFHELREVDQIDSPMTLLAQLAQFQPADSPERLERWLSRLRAYGRVRRRADRDHAGRRRVRPHPGPDRRRADDRPASAHGRPARRAGDDRRDVARGLRRRPRAGGRRRGRRRLPGGPPLSRGPRARGAPGVASAAGAGLRAERRGAVPARDPCLDDAGHGSP